MPLDLSADQAVFDGLETVTLDLAIGGVSQVYTDAYRLPERMAVGDPSDAAYLQRMTEWHLSTTVLAIDPRPGDTITDAVPDIWVIQSVRPPKFGDYWGLDCRLSEITDDAVLADVVTLWPAVYSISAMGSQVTTHPTAAAWFTAVDAKIVLRESVAETEMAQRDFVEMFDVYVAKDIDQVHDGDILKDDDTGHQYTIVSYRNRFQIDELSVIVCEDRLRGP